MRAKSCCLVATAVLLTACGSDDPAQTCESPVGNVSGNAYLPDGPASEFTVTLTQGGETVTAGSTSGSEFGVEVAPGTYSVQGEAEGCTSAPIDVEVVACTSQFIDLQLDQCDE